MFVDHVDLDVIIRCVVDSSIWVFLFRVHHRIEHFFSNALCGSMGFCDFPLLLSSVLSRETAWYHQLSWIIRLNSHLSFVFPHFSFNVGGFLVIRKLITCRYFLFITRRHIIDLFFLLNTIWCHNVEIQSINLFISVLIDIWKCQIDPALQVAPIWISGAFLIALGLWFHLLISGVIVSYFSWFLSSLIENVFIMFFNEVVATNVIRSFSI